MKRCFLLLIAARLLFPPLGTHAQINLDSGLVAYYPFNGNANDEGPFGLDGVVFGAQLTEDRFGEPNSAFLFQNTYIQVPFDTVLSPPAISISVWVQTFGKTGPQKIIGKINRDNAAGEQYALTVLNGNQASLAVKHFSNCVPGRDWNSVTSDDGVEDSTWTHIVGVFEDSVQSVFINGVLDTSRVTQKATIDFCVNGDVQIGAWWRGGFEYFQGKIDDLRFYDRGLTADEVAALFSGSSTQIETATPTFSVHVVPNPAPGAFTLSSPQAALQSVVLYDLTGRALSAEVSLQRHEAQVRCDYRGLVVVKVLTEQGSWMGKVRME